MTRKLLLHAGGDLSSAMDDIAAHLAHAQHAVFIPFAAHDHEAYSVLVSERMATAGVRLEGLHRAHEPANAIAAADAIIVGGGNSFRLVRELHRRMLLDPIRRRVADGVPYFGASAGANVACPTIRTTNDMPIVQPPSFDALNLVPFQINPHYIDPVPPEQRVGETRLQRLEEFLEENEAAVVALREGSWLVVDGDSMRLRGTTGAMLFQWGAPPRAAAPGEDLSHLLALTPRFDI
ncbi:MAG: dipeptidase PepE [Candidatus Dormibacteria bacterium]